MTKEEKASYDREYRANNKEKIRSRDILYNESKAGRACQKRSRIKCKDNHLEYCRQPQYVKWKKQYDKIHLAKESYGEYWESAIIINELEQEVRKLIPKNERAGYIRNVNRATKRGKLRRRKAILEKLFNGEIGVECLRYAWDSDFKEYLKELVIK